jgi:hypothetical protein
MSPEEINTALHWARNQGLSVEVQIAEHCVAIISTHDSRAEIRYTYEALGSISFNVFQGSVQDLINQGRWFGQMEWQQMYYGGNVFRNGDVISVRINRSDFLPPTKAAIGPSHLGPLPAPHPDTGKVVNTGRLRRTLIGVEVEDTIQKDGSVKRQVKKIDGQSD